MIRARSRTRPGITLVEILISILIMGVGVISIATLFPLGLLRLRNAQRLTRGAYLVESAIADLGSRNLLAGFSFFPNPFFRTNTTKYGPTFYNPLFFDTSAYTSGIEWGPPGFGNVGGANRYLAVAGSTQVVGGGLPVCYDPLWRCVTGSYPDPVSFTTPECRFGSGVGFLRSEGGTPAVLAHAHGLQRVSNFQASLTGAANPLATATASQVAQNNLAVLGIFISPEDVLFQEKSGDYVDPASLSAKTQTKLNNPSTIVPALSDSSGQSTLNPSPNYDWRYTWFVTGQQSDQSSTDFDGEIVICENRPFGIDVTDTKNFPGTGTYRITGETVVEAIWGFSSTPNTNAMINKTQGYASLSASRSVYLRWPNSMPDPDVRVGGWIADVTYERVDAAARSHFGFTTGVVNGLYPAQRCFWYQVAKKSEVADDPGVSGYRQMTVWTTTPLRAMTLQTFTAGGAATPVHLEAALIMPSVINVYPRTIYTR